MNKRSAEWICWVQKELVKAEMMGQVMTRREVEALADEKFSQESFRSATSLQREEFRSSVVETSSVGGVKKVEDPDDVFAVRAPEEPMLVELWVGYSKVFRIWLKIPIGWGLLKNGVKIRKDLYWKPTFVGLEDEMSHGELYSKDLNVSEQSSAWRSTTLTEIGRAHV